MLRPQGMYVHVQYMLQVGPSRSCSPEMPGLVPTLQMAASFQPYLPAASMGSCVQRWAAESRMWWATKYLLDVKKR